MTTTDHTGRRFGEFDLLALIRPHLIQAAETATAATSEQVAS
jgi:hypothetical protein